MDAKACADELQGPCRMLETVADSSHNVISKWHVQGTVAINEWHT